MSIRKSLLIFAITVPVLLLSGCLSVKPATKKTGKKLFETFFVGEEGTQYFIKPLSFESAAGDELLIDFIFRYKNKVKDSAILNMSFIGKDLLKAIDSIRFSNRSISVSSVDIDLLFNEKTKKGFLSRFSTQLPLIQLNSLFSDPNWEIQAYVKDKDYLYSSDKKTKDKIRTLNNNIFILF